MTSRRRRARATQQSSPSQEATPPKIPYTPRKRTPVAAPSSVLKQHQQPPTPLRFSLGSASQTSSTNTSIITDKRLPSSPTHVPPQQQSEEEEEFVSEEVAEDEPQERNPTPTPQTSGKTRKVFEVSEDQYIYDAVKQQYPNGGTFTDSTFWTGLSHQMGGIRSPHSLKNRFYRHINKANPIIQPTPVRRQQKKKKDDEQEPEEQRMPSPIVHEGDPDQLNESQEIDFGGAVDRDGVDESEENIEQKAIDAQNEMDANIDAQMKTAFTSYAIVQENGGLSATIREPKKKMKRLIVENSFEEEEDEDLLARQREREKRKRPRSAREEGTASESARKKQKRSVETESQDIQIPERQITVAQTRLIDEIIRKTKLEPAIVLHAIYVCSGNVKQAIDYLRGNDVITWSPEEDEIVLSKRRTKEIKQKKEQIRSEKRPENFDLRLRFLSS